MFDIYFNQITVSKANRYVLLLKTQLETVSKAISRKEVRSVVSGPPIPPSGR